MADNVTVTPGAGATVAADDVGGVLYQRVKLAVGVDGSATDVSSSAPMPISGTVSITDISNAEYMTVAASATSQVLGTTGATGDFLGELLVIPATTSPGAITIADGTGSAITVFTGGASSVSNLVPFSIPLGIKSTSGAWKVTTGTNVSVVAVGNFT